MEEVMGEGHREAKERLIKKILGEVRESVDRIHNYTSFHAIRSFTPAEVEILLNHIDECHKVLFELSEINDYEMPYRIPKLIYAARDLRRIVS